MELVLRIMMFTLSTAMFIAAWLGIDYAFHLNIIITSILALILLLGFPVVLAFVAAYGAVNVWGIPIWAALLLIAWPLVLSIIMNGIYSIFSFRILKKLKKTNEYDS
ncbi:hypothetical protein RHO14_04690 [Orbus wheelerorum]|uniref:hypothetical protein n=1 Tax=Orbus wheelerorum TaxID=3074111 RepID=UPI00370D39E1